MSVRKLTASLLTALALLGGFNSVNGQEHAPLADPFEFDPDFRWFEPVYNMDLEGLKPEKRAANGWFATYDRLNLHVSRPDVNEIGASETQLDGGWGHRYEIGYMLPGEDKGWMFNWTGSEVYEGFVVRQERLNRFIDPATGFDTIAPPFGVAVRQEEDNNRGYNFRFYDITDTDNVLNYDSYELNKTWRMTPYHYGGILEPLVGIRWMRIRDLNALQTYQAADSNPPLTGPNFTNGELFTSSVAVTENEMFGGQLGFRYFKFVNRFTLSSDFRTFFGGSWQESRSQTFSELTDYDNIGEGGQVVRIFADSTKPQYTRNDEFFVGFDVRGDVGYQLTKMISVRFGAQLIYIGRGVWRGGDGTVVPGGDNDQDVLLVGGTAGLNLNH